MARMQLKGKRLFRFYTFNIDPRNGDTLSIRVVVLFVSHTSPLIKDQIQRSNEEIILLIMKATSLKVKRKQNTEDLALDYGYYLKA